MQIELWLKYVMCKAEGLYFGNSAGRTNAEKAWEHRENA